MFRLLTGRHRLGATGEHADVALQQRISELQAVLIRYKTLA